MRDMSDCCLRPLRCSMNPRPTFRSLHRRRSGDRVAILSRGALRVVGPPLSRSGRACASTPTRSPAPSPRALPPRPRPCRCGGRSTPRAASWPRRPARSGSSASRRRIRLRRQGGGGGGAGGAAGRDRAAAGRDGAAVGGDARGPVPGAGGGGGRHGAGEDAEAEPARGREGGERRVWSGGGERRGACPGTAVPTGTPRCRFAPG